MSNPMRRVLFVAYHFPPIGGAGVQRSLKFVRYLPECGYHATVITGPGRQSDAWTPIDNTLAAELPEDVAVYRLPKPEPRPPSARRSRAERWLKLRSEWSRWWVDGVVETGKRKGQDVSLVFATMSPFQSGFAAARLARELGRPWVADLRDPWVLDETAIYPSRAHRLLELRRMRALLASAAAIVLNTPEAAALVRTRFPELCDRRVTTIPNGFDAADFEGSVPDRTDDSFQIVHAGYLHTEIGRRHRRLRRALGGSEAYVNTMARSHVYLHRAIERVRSDNPSLGARLELHLAGFLSQETSAGLDSGFERPHAYLEHARSVELVRSADLLFLPLHDLPQGRRASIVPGKSYEYLASRRPVLAAVPDGDARNLFAEVPNAHVCRPTDVEAMARVIADLARRDPPRPRSQGAPDELLQRYERHELTRRLASVFDDVLGAGAEARSLWPEETLESADECPVCDGDNRVELHAELGDHASPTPGKWALYRCSDCGSAYLDPRPNPESIGRAYSEYYTHAEPSLQEAPPARGQLKRALRNGYLNSRFGYSLHPSSPLGSAAMRVFALRRAQAGQWIRHLPRPPGGASLLDVGCGNGAFLIQMKGTGWSLRGIDPDPEAVARVREAGIPADEGFLTDRSFPANNFDAITLSHVVEHAHQPVELLRECHRILRPGGVLWVATPNIASPGHKLFGRHWRGLDPPRHLVLFTPGSLKEALESVGFELLAQPPACTGSWCFRASAAASQRLDPTSDFPPLSRHLRWRAHLADLRTVLHPDSGEEIVLLARKPSQTLSR